jgi:hypothetical protein
MIGIEYRSLAQIPRENDFREPGLMRLIEYDYLNQRPKCCADY